MKGVVRVGLVLVAVSLYSGMRSQGYQALQLEPVREQEFVGHLEGRDFYWACRLDSNGNLFLRTRNDIVQKISVDGSPGYEINFRDHVEVPLGIHDIAVGPDDVLYVVGVDLAGTGTVVYRILPGENWPVIFERMPAVDPCNCAVASDLSLHVGSFETGWMNEVLSGTFNPEISEGFDRSTQSMFDVSVRRFSRDGHRLGGYAPIRLPIDAHQLLRHEISNLCNKRLVADRDGGTHLLDTRTGICVCYSADGIPVGESRLELDSREATPVIYQIVSLGAGFFAYKAVYTDLDGFVKRSELIVADHRTAIQRKFEVKEGAFPYQLDTRSDELLQYWFIKDRIFTLTYKISDLVQ